MVVEQIVVVLVLHLEVALESVSFLSPVFVVESAASAIVLVWHHGQWLSDSFSVEHVVVEFASAGSSLYLLKNRAVVVLMKVLRASDA